MMKSQKRLGKKIWFVIRITVVILIAGSVIYIMANGMGLVDGLDFGAGAYYYADIPNFSSYVSGDHYDTQLPMWIFILLFLAWGALMYRIWCQLEKKSH